VITLKRNVPRNEKNEERKKIALKLGKPDAVPVDIVNQCSFLSGWLGFRAYDYFKRPDFMLECQIKFRERFRGLGTLGPDYGVAVEPSCFGAEIIWPLNAPPWAMPLIDDVDAIPDFADTLKIPDPIISGYSPLVTSTYYYMKGEVGDLVSPPCGSLGPFEISCLLLGTENMMLGLKLYPDQVHEILKKLTVFVKNLIESRYELFGSEMDLVYMGEDSPGCLSAQDFEEFVIPYTGSIFKSLGSSSTTKMWHCDGKLEQLIDILPKLGINALTSFDPHTDVSLFKEKIGDKICLIGNIDPIRTLSEKSPEEIEREVKRIIDIGKPNGGFVIATGGELCNGVPAENVDIFLDAIEKYSKY
jgi:Uroporphyrinogen-III decarboxylase